jgi:hypothetical protein
MEYEIFRGKVVSLSCFTFNMKLAFFNCLNVYSSDNVLELHGIAII